MAETFETIATKLDLLSQRLDERFDGIDQRFDGIDQRLDGIDQRLEGFDKQFQSVTETFVELRQYIEFGYSSLESALNGMGGRFDRLERKLDQAIVVRRRQKRRR